MKILYLNANSSQIDANTYDKVFRDTGRDQSELKRMIAFAREGDTATFESFFALAQSLENLIRTADCFLSKKVELIFLKEQISSLSDCSLASVVSALSSFEDEVVRRNRQDGIERAKQEGRYKGRVPIKIDQDVFLAECRKWRAGKQTAVTTMRKLNLKPGTFYNRVKELGI